MMKEEPPDAQTSRIQSKHKLTMEEIRESIVESLPSSEEDHPFKTELHPHRLLSESDKGTYLSLEYK